MIKMVVVDIDGTILGKNLKLSEKIKTCFKNLIKNNIKVVLATGRMYCASLPLAKELELIDPIISYQGGYIRECTEEENVIREILIEKEKALQIIEEIKSQNIHINLYAKDTLFVENNNEIIKNYCADRIIPYHVIKNFEQLEYRGYHKILAIDNDTKKISKLIEDLSEKYKNEMYVTHSTPYFCEISNITATKGAAIKFLAQKWDIKKEEILAAGDQNNDIEMLMNAGVKIAMGNASEKLKKIADFVTLDVDNDGVCYAIEKFLIKENELWI